MGWIDNVIAAISPQTAAKREAWRQALEQMRNYDAGSDGRLNAGWRTTFDQSADATDANYRSVVRNRARDLERNSDNMNSLLGAYKRNVIGQGFRLQAMTRSERLNAEIEKWWKYWCKPENCDVTGNQSFNQLLRMCVVRKKVDGGVLIVKRYVDDTKIPLQLQILEVDELDSGAVSADRTHRVVNGIEYNQYNRAVGYWVSQYQIDGMTPAEPIYIPAKDVIFYFTKRRPSQIREMSDMAPTLTRIRDLNEFITAVSVKQRIQACLSVFIKKSLPVTGIGRQSSMADRREYDGKTLTPGMIKELNAGDDVVAVNPTGQSADATSFTKLQLRMIGAGQGISYEATSRDMSETSYSSARQGIIEDELTFYEETEQLVSIMDNIYEAFLEACVLAGLIKPKAFFSDRERYTSHAWIKQPKAWIDPLKEASATKTALNYGIKTFKQVAAENGRDWKAQIDDMAEVNEYALSKGLNLGGVLFNGKLADEEETSETGEGGTDGESADRPDDPRDDQKPGNAGA